MKIYDEKYKDKNLYWGGKPSDFVVEVIKHVQGNETVLDLGSGEGRNAIYLAEQGYPVTAVDSSEVGITKTIEYAKAKNIPIEGICEKIETFLDTANTYDIIVCEHVLQFIHQDNIGTVINKVKEKTKQGGYNVIGSFLQQNAGQKERAISRGRYLFDEKELLGFYSDWEIIKYQEELGPRETHGEEPHRHYLVNLIAKKS